MTKIEIIKMMYGPYPQEVVNSTFARKTDSGYVHTGTIKVFEAGELVWEAETGIPRKSWGEALNDSIDLRVEILAHGW